MTTHFVNLSFQHLTEEHIKSACDAIAMKSVFDTYMDLYKAGVISRAELIKQTQEIVTYKPIPIEESL